MKLTVVLINWRSEERTLQCVRRLRRWSDLRPELLVVDNESSEGSRTRLRAELLDDEILSSSDNLGFGGANNRALDRLLHSGADRVLLLNTDAEVDETQLRQLLQRMDDDPRVAVIGPVVFEGREGEEVCLVGGRDIAEYEATRIVEPSGKPPPVDGHPLRQVDYVPGMVFLSRLEVFRQVGLLDECYFFSGEIADLCKRATSAGLSCWIDLEATARHCTDPADAGQRDALYLYYSLRNRFLYVRKHCAGARWRYSGRWLRRGWQWRREARAAGLGERSRAISLALRDGLLGRFGNRNDLFV